MAAWSPNYWHELQNLHWLIQGQNFTCELKDYCVDILKHSLHTHYHNLEATQMWGTPHRKWENVAYKKKIFLTVLAFQNKILFLDSIQQPMH